MCVGHIIFIGERWCRRSNAIISQHDHVVLLFALVSKMLLTFSKDRKQILIASLKQIN